MVALLGLGACSEMGGKPLDPDYMAPEERGDLPTPETLTFALETLADLPPAYQATVLSDPPRADRRKTWQGDQNTQPQASLVLRHAMDETALTFPMDPKEAIKYWPDMGWRSLDFKTLYETENRLGRALWRRFVMGPFTCVVMQQVVDRTVLAGYYCAPAGEALSAGQAETVVQSIRFEDSSAPAPKLPAS